MYASLSTSSAPVALVVILPKTMHATTVQYYGVYISQLVRIGRICSNYTQFTWRHYKLTQRLIHQGFRYSTLCIAFRKFARKYTHVLEKYGWSIRKHIEDGVCLPAMDPFLSRHVSRRSI